MQMKIFARGYSTLHSLLPQSFFVNTENIFTDITQDRHDTLRSLGLLRGGLIASVDSQSNSTCRESNPIKHRRASFLAPWNLPRLCAKPSVIPYFARRLISVSFSRFLKSISASTSESLSRTSNPAR